MTSPISGKRYQITPGPDGMSIQHRGRRFGLGRHVNHDPRSRRYPYRGAAVSLSAVRHARHVPIFDQGDLGSCVGNAALGILATGPYWDALSESARTMGPMAATPWNETGAVRLYSEITRADDYPGDYPPDDTGSDGLAAAKVLTADGVVPGYQHTFDVASALRALQDFPLLVGTVWTNAMFDPDPYGYVRPTGAVAGGHEWIVDEYVPASSRWGEAIGGVTSWGVGFGLSGRFYLTVASFTKLLGQDGDVIVLAPPAAPAPTPEPAPNDALADVALADAMREWLTDKGL